MISGWNDDIERQILPSFYTRNLPATQRNRTMMYRKRKEKGSGQVNRPPLPLFRGTGGSRSTRQLQLENATGLFDLPPGGFTAHLDWHLAVDSLALLKIDVSFYETYAFFYLVGLRWYSPLSRRKRSTAPDLGLSWGLYTQSAEFMKFIIALALLCAFTMYAFN